MPKILLAALSLAGLLVIAAVFANNGGRAEPALTRSDSVLPPPSAHLFYFSAAHARFTRWDCSDWQPHPAVADADNELASSILETLAANRGKTLYCALDQSDTWTKRQVYDNAHAHNDRDRTQYDGSQGQGRFRGFTAGQEGWLTDGEHGITGVSPERIFEFPEVKKKRRKNKKKPVRYVQVVEEFALAADASRLVRVQGSIPGGGPWSNDVHGRTSGYSAADGAYTAPSNAAAWNALAQTVAGPACVDEGGEGARDGATNSATTVASSEVTGYQRITHWPGYKWRKWQTRQYTATCYKTVYRRARDDD